MPESLASRFAPIVTQMPLAFFTGGPPPRELLIAERGALAIHWAPFESVNVQARIVLVGITPGYHQMTSSLLELRRLLNHGTALNTALVAAKRTVTLSEPIQKSLVGMLNHFGINQLLDIPDCASLFREHANQVQYTSLLRYPVFRSGCHYTGTPDMISNTFLQSYLMEYFAAEAKTLDRALFVPLGPSVSKTMRELAERGVLNGDRLLDGLETPSPANTERIAYLLERKPREKLSPKTNPLRIDQARESLRGKISRLFAASGRQQK